MRKRPRDFQRQRLYDAERKAPRGQEWDKVPQLQDYVDQLISSEWWQARYAHIEKIQVLDGRGRRRGCGGRNRDQKSGFIKMPRFTRYERYTLHEVSHVVQPIDESSHGLIFCSIYLCLVHFKMGSKASEQLRNAFTEGNVKFLS